MNNVEMIREIDRLVLEQNIRKDSLRYGFEKGEFTFTWTLPEVTNKLMIEILLLLKRQRENWRIHTFEKGYMVVQALNDNLFDGEKMMENLKVRLSGIYGEKNLEIQKRGAMTEDDLNIVLAVLQLLGNVKKANPLQALAQAGCAVYTPTEEAEDFKTFAGYDDIKNQVKESVIYPLKNPEVYDAITQKTRKHYAVNRPKAVLFSGPPGVGKTTMAKLIAKEADLPLVYIPLENIMSAYYGESSKKLAFIFDVAAKTKGKGLVLFIDEIDSLAPSRNEKLFEATRRMLSVLLRKIEGLESHQGYLTIGATNRKKDLDSALISRFDTIIDFPYPSQKDIFEILHLYATHLSAEEKKELSSLLLGLSPRSIADVCKRAERIQARNAISANRKAETVTPPPLEIYKTCSLSFQDKKDME